MIALSTLTFDINGHFVINDDIKSTHPNFTRRLTRTATLDGNSTINDAGYSDGSGSFMIKTFQTELSSELERLIKTYPLMYLSSKQGVFLGAMKSLNTQKTPLEFTFLIKEKVSA